MPAIALRSTEEKFEATPDEVDLVAVENICVHLEVAGQTSFPSEALLRAMVDIEKRYRDANRIPLSKKARDRMLSAIVCIEHAAFDGLLAEFYNGAPFAFGFEAFANQIVLCAETASKTAKRPADQVKDICAYALIFRNTIHNMWLSEKISERAIRCHEQRVASTKPCGNTDMDMRSH